MNDKPDAAVTDILNTGEEIQSLWSFNYLDNATVDAGAITAPGKIDGPEGRKFAALNMIKNDLVFSLGCLEDAKKLGPPTAENRALKALIFAGVTAYARPFKTGVRELKLTPEEFSEPGQIFSTELHEYLIALRDKHIAHSVNEFERCEATTVMVGTPEGQSFRLAGIGFTFLNAIGLSAALLDRAIAQISEIIKLIEAKIVESRDSLFKEQSQSFAKDQKWEHAPLAARFNRQNVAKRRQ